MNISALWDGKAGSAVPPGIAGFGHFLPQTPRAVHVGFAVLAGIGRLRAEEVQLHGISRFTYAAVPAMPVV